MSLHAELTPEAKARLRSQQRISTISSFVIALLLMLLIGVILYIISISLNLREIPTIVSYSSGVEDKEQIETRKVTTTTQRKPTSAAAPSQAKVIAANTASATAVPTPDINVPNPSVNFGDDSDFGSGWGSATQGAGGSFGAIPETMKKRCSLQDRLDRLKENGGNAECEEAVVRALRYLKETQNEDGSWTEGDYSVAMTGFAVLSFLGHCETTQSPEFGMTVLNALVNLVDIAQRNEGKLATDFRKEQWSYEHAIATYALAEAYSLCTKSFGENIPHLEEAVQATGQFLIDNQHISGGWDYAYDTEGSRGGDTSISGWHLQALKALKVTGLEFGGKGLARTARAGMEFFEARQDQDGAVGYTAAGNAQTDDRNPLVLAAVGALCFQMWDEPNASFTRNAIRFIDKHNDFEWEGPSGEIYGHYYAAQALLNAGGDYWRRYNEHFRDAVLGAQLEDGSFKDAPEAIGSAMRFKGGGKFNIHYRTCLAALMLETYYRFLPASE